MSTITKEWLKQKIAEMEAASDEIPFGLGEDGTNTLAALRIALASLEAVPVAYMTYKGYLLHAADPKLAEYSEPTQLYDAPPAPVALPSGYSDFEEIWSSSTHPLTQDDEMKDFAWDIWNACRAAMLQGAEPVTPAYKSPDDFDFDRFNDVVWLEAVASNPHMHSLNTSTIAMVALELNRKLADCNSPVIPDGWVACSERMPEAMVSVLVTGDWFLHAVSLWDGASWCDLDFEPPVTHWMPLPAAPQQEANK